MQQPLLPHNILHHTQRHISGEKRLTTSFFPDLVKPELWLRHVLILVLNLRLSGQEILHVLVERLHISISQLHTTPLRSICAKHCSGHH